MWADVLFMPDDNAREYVGWLIRPVVGFNCGAGIA